MPQLERTLAASILVTLLPAFLAGACATAGNATLLTDTGGTGNEEEVGGTGGSTPIASGGFPTSGGTSTGGASSTGGTISFGGGFISSGGTSVVVSGGTSSGGRPATGGTAHTGGTYVATGGTNVATGGTNVATGGTYVATGGVPSYGGVPIQTGGTVSLTGGTSSTGGSGPTVGSLNVTTGGFFEAAPLKGYVWSSISGTGSSMTTTPADFSKITTLTTQLCAAGTVAKTTDYSGSAILGVNINQASGATAKGVWAPASTASGGVVINVSNPGASVIRVQIQATGGDKDASLRWCTELKTFGSSVTIPWSSFVTNCWTGGTPQTPYAGTPGIEAIMVQVPGQGGTDGVNVSYNFCINALSAS